jgi:predicted restriction endonuclease
MDASCRPLVKYMITKQDNEARNAYMRQWRKKNPEKARASHLAWRQRNRERVNAKSRAWAAAHPERESFRRRKRRAQFRAAVFAHYGKACRCCGEAEEQFLCIDHINGNGNKHRKETLNGFNGKMYEWLVKSGFPEGFQTLCHNCNSAKGFYGMCPHERARRAVK